MINGKIIIGDVAKDSPAEKAGLKEGDIVFAVNNNFSQNMQQYKASLFKMPGERLKVIVIRNGAIYGN